MKVVLFCGGLGMRLREFSETIPKPMVNIGYRPIVWHIMKYYAHYGHKDFILCLGYGADFIKNYFLNYNECVSNDFVLAEEARASSFSTATSTIGTSPSPIPAPPQISDNVSRRSRNISTVKMCFSPITATVLLTCPSTTRSIILMREHKVASFLCVKPNLKLPFHHPKSGRRRGGDQRRDSFGYPDQRRVLRVPQGDLSVYEGR